MSTTATKRFVNLGTARTMLPGPNGQHITVHPFSESLDRSTFRVDAVYVLEGEFWSRYATGVMSQLDPFPRPNRYGREDFPVVPGLREDGSRVDVVYDEMAEPEAQVGVRALPGKYRLVGDVVTPEGKIRKTLPNGEVVLVEDTPENRATVHSLSGVETDRNPTIREGIEQWLQDMHVTTHQQFADLSDDVLLQIPGVNSNNLGALRQNISRVMQEREELISAPETGVGETAATATVSKSIDDVLDGADDDAEGDEDDAAPAPKRVTKKKVAKKKVTKKKATKKKAKRTTRRKASD